jgi:hypothetical protein
MQTSTARHIGSPKLAYGGLFNWRIKFYSKRTLMENSNTFVSTALVSARFATMSFTTVPSFST